MGEVSFNKLLEIMSQKLDLPININDQDKKYITDRIDHLYIDLDLRTTEEARDLSFLLFIDPKQYLNVKIRYYERSKKSKKKNKYTNVLNKYGIPYLCSMCVWFTGSIYHRHIELDLDFLFKFITDNKLPEELQEELIATAYSPKFYCYLYDIPTDTDMKLPIEKPIFKLDRMIMEKQYQAIAKDYLTEKEINEILKKRYLSDL
jgi:hypothetical protein